MSDSKIRNRIQALRRVRAKELKVDPRNWKHHPNAQRSALQKMLERVGWVDAVIARETAEGLMLVDGHLRAGLDPETVIPVLVVDLDEKEAGEVLATLDPIVSMSEADAEALDSLLLSVTDEDFASLSEDIRDLTGVSHAVLEEQETQADYVPADDSRKSNTGYQPLSVIDDVVAFTVHVPKRRFDHWLAKLRKLQEHVGADSLNKAVLQTIAKAIKEIDG